MGAGGRALVLGLVDFCLGAEAIGVSRSAHVFLLSRFRSDGARAVLGRGLGDLDDAAALAEILACAGCAGGVYVAGACRVDG